MKLDQKVTKPPAASETRWAGLLPQIAWMNEHHDVLRMYERKPAQNCAVLDDGSTFTDHNLQDYDWILIGDLDAVLRPVVPFISTMEATERVTVSLVIPMTLAIIHATSKEVPVQRYTYTNGVLTNDDFKEDDLLACEVQEVRRILHSENKRRFWEEERIGHREDLLICTILDPRFKLMNFIGSSAGMKEEAEGYLLHIYNKDWSPAALAKKKAKAEKLKAKEARALEKEKEKNKSGDTTVEEEVHDEDDSDDDESDDEEENESDEEEIEIHEAEPNALVFAKPGTVPHKVSNCNKDLILDVMS